MRARTLLAAAIALPMVGALGGLTVSTPAAASETTAITGTAVISGAPANSQNFSFYAVACPPSVAYSIVCSGMEIGTPTGSEGRYRIELPSGGAWKVGLYYYAFSGQIIQNRPVTVSVTPGRVAHENLGVAYEVPAVQGTVIVTGAPANFDSRVYMGVQACPAGADFTLGCPGGTEAYENVAPGRIYSIDLHPGHWALAPYYVLLNNTASFVGTATPVTATKGATVHQNVSIAFQGY